jgi:hypothetical protein
MFAASPSFLNGPIEESLSRQYTREMRVSPYARQLFASFSRLGWLSRIFGGTHALEDLSRMTAGRKVVSQHAKGNQTVSIDAIRGSEGRCNDFDARFHPIKEHTRYRWERVASARQEGTGLPAVDLIQIGANYYVRDGHHRISVASALGEKVIDANVTVMELE